MPNEFEKLAHKDAELIAWQFLLAARALPKDRAGPVSLSFDMDQQRVIVSDERGTSMCLSLDKTGVWRGSSRFPLSFRALFDLYLPILSVREKSSFVIAHLGQSIDSRIATSNGDSFYVTGEQNRKHLHCLRALCDAVIVGASTVLADDPQLTTRAVTGNNPVRIVIDPHARLTGPLGIFNDAQARTILVHQSSTDLTDLQMHFGPKVSDANGNTVMQVERWVVPDTAKSLPVAKIVDMLVSKNMVRLFVEGGGITVSRFFEAGSLSRLHIAVAPVLVGQGTQALEIAGVEKMLDAHRPPCAMYLMGDDILWDFDISALESVSNENPPATRQNTNECDQPSVQRIR